METEKINITQYVTSERDSKTVHMADPKTQYLKDNGLPTASEDELDALVSEFNKMQNPVFIPFISAEGYEACRKEAEAIVKAYPLSAFTPPDAKTEPDTYIKNMYKTNMKLADLPDHTKEHANGLNIPVACRDVLKDGIFPGCRIYFWGEQLPWKSPPEDELCVRHLCWIVHHDEPHHRPYVWMRKSEYHPVVFVLVSDEQLEELYSNVPFDVVPKTNNQFRICDMENINYLAAPDAEVMKLIPKQLLSKKHHLFKATKPKVAVSAPAETAKETAKKEKKGTAAEKGAPKKLVHATVMPMPPSKVFKDLWREGADNAISVLQGRQLSQAAAKGLGLTEFEDVEEDFERPMTADDIGGDITGIHDLFGIEVVSGAKMVVEDNEVEYEKDYSTFDGNPKALLKFIEGQNKQKAKENAAKKAEAARRDAYGGLNIKALAESEEKYRGTMVGTFASWMKHGFNKMPATSLLLDRKNEVAETGETIVKKQMVLMSSVPATRKAIDDALVTINEKQQAYIAAQQPNLEWATKATLVPIAEEMPKKKDFPKKPIGKPDTKTTQHEQKKMSGKKSKKTPEIPEHDEDDDDHMDNDDDGDDDDGDDDVAQLRKGLGVNGGDSDDDDSDDDDDEDDDDDDEDEDEEPVHQPARKKTKTTAKPAAAKSASASKSKAKAAVKPARATDIADKATRDLLIENKKILAEHDVKLVRLEAEMKESKKNLAAQELELSKKTKELDKATDYVRTVRNKTAADVDIYEKCKESRKKIAEIIAKYEGALVVKKSPRVTEMLVIKPEYTIDKTIRDFVVKEVHDFCDKPWTFKQLQKLFHDHEEEVFKLENVKRTDPEADKHLILPKNPNLSAEKLILSQNQNTFLTPAVYVIVCDPDFIPLATTALTAGNNMYELFRKYVVLRADILAKEPNGRMFSYFAPSKMDDPNRFRRLKELKYKLAYLRLKYEEMINRGKKDDDRKPEEEPAAPAAAAPVNDADAELAAMF